MTSRELARPEDKPPSLVIGPTASQQDQIEYRNNEVARLQEENQELRRRLKRNEILERLFYLDCPRELTRKTTILECITHRQRGDCVKRNCVPRTMLLAKITL